MLYKQLRRTNRDYCADTWRELGQLYAGGYEMRRHAAAYMHRLVGESSQKYEERVKEASYINHLAPIINYFAASTFQKEFSVQPAADRKDTTTPGSAPVEDGYWAEFSKDADRNGNPISQVLRGALTTALLKRTAYIACDFPNVQTEFASRADETAAGAARGYCFELPPESLVNWKLGRDGRFVWAVIKTLVESDDDPENIDDSYVEQYKIWRMRPGAEFADWELYETPPIKQGAVISDDLVMQPKEAGVSTFRQIPIIPLTMPAGAWVGNHIGPSAAEHFRRRSSLNCAENRSLVIVPVMKRGPEMGLPTAHGMMIPSPVQQDPNRGDDPVDEFRRAGYVVLGTGDELGFAEPSGAAYAIIDNQLDKLIDEMYRVTHQMANSIVNSTTSLGRSGLSKQMDQSATSIVLEALGFLCSELARKVYDCLSGARGESVVWQPHGLDSYDATDRAQVLDEAAQASGIPIPSLTFKKLHRFKLAKALLGRVDQRTLETIQKEIEEGVEVEDIMHRDMEAAEANDVVSGQREQPPAMPAENEGETG